MMNEEDFELMTKNCYQDAQHVLNEKLKQNKRKMEYKEFQSLAKYITLRQFSKLLKGEMNFEEFKSEIFKDSDKLKQLCLDDLKQKFSPDLFKYNPTIKQLIDDI